MSSLESRMEALKAKLDAAGQSQVLAWWSEGSEAEKAALVDQLEAIDLPDVLRMHKAAVEAAPVDTGLLSPIPSDRCGSATESKDQTAAYTAVGLSLVKEGKVGVILLAGGQGTRLGVSYPKGQFDIGLPSESSLFRLQAERIRKVEELAGGCGAERPKVPWFVMTSPATRAATEAYFQEQAYFGMHKDQVHFFDQGALPCFDKEGKLLLAEKFLLAQAPDGNGGLYAALHKAALVPKMLQMGVEHLHVYCVDNCLVKVADPAFIGFAAAKEAECANKVVEKTEAHEAVGVVCQVARADGSQEVRVVEYSEITRDQAEATDADGKLTFRAGNIANHYFSMGFLKRLVEEHRKDFVPHPAHKKIPYVAKDGTLIKPGQPNGLKMELFVFDAFAFAKTFAVWSVERSEEFAPLKNADSAGKDCASTSRAAVLAQHRRWLTAAGAKVEGEVEIAPMVSYGGEGLDSLDGKTVTQDSLEQLL